jgi:radical SAM superfamily enzyme YgiQ (UPF0313 family)
MAKKTEKTKKPKILLLFPNPIATIPGGFTFVAKRFKRNGFEVKTFINTFSNFYTVDDILKKVANKFKPDVIGLSYATYNVLEVYRLQKMCKETGYFVIAGGNHPSIMPEECLHNGADMVFRGEAELGIDDFCSWFISNQNPAKRSKLRGVSYIDEHGQTVHNALPPRITDLDSIGGLDFSSIDINQFKTADGSVKGLNIISCGRGCPFRCSFCSHSNWYKYASRSAESIVREMIEANKKYGITNFWLSDETFTVNRERMYEFCRKFREAKLPFTWMMGTRVDCVDENLLRAMKDSGLAQITYGVESADDETLRKVRKGYTAKKAYDTIVMTAKIGMPMYINLMTGFPWETPAHVQNNIKFIKKISKYVNCFQLYGAVIPYPDTPIYEEYREKEGFTDFWLKDKYQNAGMVIYQNVANPYKVSTYFQRNLYDDTYVAEDYFFKFTPKYKKAVAKMGLLIGWKAIQAQYKSLWKRYFKFAIGYFSHVLYLISPNIEKRIVGSLIKKNKVHENRLTGAFIKK